MAPQQMAMAGRLAVALLRMRGSLHRLAAWCRSRSRRRDRLERMPSRCLSGSSASVLG
jgi:hypothetical protein